MEEQRPSSDGRADDDASGSPKRKKIRSKYAARACVSCRRSKLKCSGENPCQRCLDNGRRCFYSEDQTAAEALQNLSRPTPVQPPPSSTTNGNGAARRNILPRSEIIERRASDASVLGGSMEARMARIEGMMEALIQDRGIGLTPRGSMERDESISDGFHTDSGYPAPMEAYAANLVPVRPQHGFAHDSPDLRPRHSISRPSPPSSDQPGTIRVGGHQVAFPSPSDYRRYLDYFFADINPAHPCVNEAEFRTRSEQMLVSTIIHISEIGFLALNYIIFACIDILVDTTPPGVTSKPAGWLWFQIADDLVGKRKLSGRGDLSLIQFLIYEAIYLSCADRPNASYNAIGLACRLCFQFGLHQQSRWRHCTPFQVHMRQRIIWTVYVTDRRIALSCGRPYGIRDSDVDVEQPLWLYDRELYPDQPLPEPDVNRSTVMFLHAMTSWGKFVGDVWDQVFSPSCTKRALQGENAFILDARIKHWTEAVLPTIPLLPPDHQSESRHLRQHTLVHTRFNHLRTLLSRRTMTSLKYDGNTGRLCGDLAIDTVDRIKTHAAEAKIPSSFRFHMTASLGGAILVLATLLVRDLTAVSLQDKAPAYAESFRDAVGILHDLAIYLQVARRVSDDLKDIIHLVTTILNGGPVDMLPAQVEELFPYNFLDFAEQTGLSDAVGAGLWSGAEIGNSDSWDFELQPFPAGFHGVPWI